MKRFFALAALLLGLAACQTEPEGLDVNVGGAVDTTITVAIPEGTRASSANGFDISDPANTNYSLRYILEIYRVDDNSGKCQRHVLVSDNKSVAFPVRLVPDYDYNVVVWADIVEGDSQADRYYDTSKGLDEVTIIENNEIKWNAMDETRDAYTATATFNNFQVSQLNTPISLTRPFAKLRVVATDIEDIRKVGLKPTTATVAYSQEMYRTFDARTGAASNAASKSHTISYATPVYEDATGEYTLFADYFFVPSDGTAKFNLKVYAEAGRIKENNFNTEISVQRNKLTTIKGDVLTVGGNVEVKVENGFGEFETINYADNAETLQQIINEAPEDKETNITLGGDIDLGDLFGASIHSTRAAATLPIVIAEGKVVVLDLNGHKITTPWEDQAAQKHYYAFKNYGSLTIQDSKGNGEIIARGIFNYGTMTLESGTINACDGNGGYGVRNYDGAMFIMEGGSIVTSNEDGDAPTEGYDATTLRVDKGATATINGGVVNNVSNYTFAIDNHGEFTVNGGTFTSIHSTVSSYGTMTINGGTFTCDGLEGITAHALVAWDGSETTINGGTFDGKDNYNGFNVDADEGAIVNINGGKFLHVHSGSLYGKGTIIVKGGEFFDDPSARVAEGYEAIKENGVWNVHALPVAQIGETEYYTLEEAVAAAKAGDTITLLLNITLEKELGLPAGIIFNGNGKQINGSIYAGGDLTFVGHTKVTAFSASYYDRVITIGEGACLEVTGTGRVTLGYGNTFNITGSIKDAKTADKANIQPSLIIPAGISITGDNDATMNVTNAYISLGNTSSKNSAANGEFTLNFTNSIIECTNQFTLSEPTGGKNPEFNVNITNSVMTTTAKLCIAAENSEVVVNNSILDLKNNFRNSGTFTLTNGSKMTGSTIQFGENGGNNGTINVDNSTFTIIAGSTGNAFDGKGIGSINATNGATVKVDYYQDMTINVDETSTFVGTDIYGNRKIYYVSDEMALEPTNPDALGGAKVVSNVWDKTTGKGVITFDRDLTTIGEKAFQRLTNTTPSNWITSITLPESVKTIGDYAFYQCYSLKKVNIPSKVVSIGERAFGSCWELAEINCEPTTPPTLGDSAFANVPATCYVPAASVDAYKAAWSDYEGNIEGR